jgi:hypothetical protein
MALVTANTSFKIGYDQRSFGSGNVVTINSTATGLAIPFLAQFSGSLTRVIASIQAINTSITNLDVGIMASNATGDLPSDTYLATPNTISATSTATPYELVINLTNPVSVVKGTVYWLAYKPNASFTGIITLYQNFAGVFSYNGTWRSATRASSTWSRSGTTGSFVIYGNATRWYSVDIASLPDDASPITGAANQEYGLAFTLDADHPAIRVKGISFANCLNGNVTTGNPGMLFLCNIRNSAGTLLYSFGSQDTDRISTTTGNANAYFWNQTASDIWLEPNTKYYLMLAFSGTFTNAPQITTYNWNSANTTANGAYLANYANRSSGGVITETTTEFMAFHIEVDAIRFNDTGGVGGYGNASPMFTAGFSG